MRLHLMLVMLSAVAAANPPELLESGHNLLGDKTSKEDSCEVVMGNHGINFTTFGLNAGHGCHSINLEEIREWFEPEATEDNQIPHLNFNLSSDQIILFSATLAGYDNDFKTMALKVMAWFMLNDSPDFFQQGSNILEKVTHQYHMHEIYTAASPIYKRLKDNPPTDPEFCPCINDITGNGILTMLVTTARHFEYFSAENPLNAREGRCDFYPYWGRHKRQAGCARRKKRSTEKATKDLIDQYQKDFLSNSSRENAKRLLDVAPWIHGSLVGPEQWISYEAMLTQSAPTDEAIEAFANFMYCKLNEPKHNHPRGLF